MWKSEAGDIEARFETNGSEIQFVHHAKPLSRISFPIATARAMAFSEDERRFSVGASDGTVRVWSVFEGTLVATFKHSAAVHALSFSPDNRFVASGGGDHVIQIWNIDQNTLQSKLTGHQREVTGICYLPSGNRLISCSGKVSEDSEIAGEMLLWNLDLQQVCLELKSGRDNLYCGVAVNADGSRIYGGANSLASGVDGQIIVWESTSDDRESAPLQHDQNERPVSSGL